MTVTPKVTNVVFDCNDLDVMVAFWGDLLSMKVTSRDAEWADLERLGPGGPLLSFQLVPEGKQVKNRIHLDLDVPDIHEAGGHARELGATPMGELQGADPDAPFQVWQDPEGNEFCLVTEK